MSKIQSLLQDFLSSSPQTKPAPDFLSMKNGILPLKIDYNPNPSPSQPLPTIIIDTSLSPSPSFNNSLSSPTTYSMCSLVPQIKIKQQSQIVDNIIEQSVRESSLKISQNKNKQLSTIQHELGDIIQTNTVDVGTFSQNCITNITEYSIQGEPVTIHNAIIQPQIKRYVQVQREELAIYDSMPHPIRKKKKVKKALQIDRKSVIQIMQEFQILNMMFDSKNITTDEKSDTQKILQAVSLKDNSYQDLWQKIVGDIKVDKSKNKKRKNSDRNLATDMGDEQFQKGIQRIVNEAVEYQKQALEIQNQEQAEQEQLNVIQEEEGQIKVEQSKQKKDEESNDFQKAKIQKKAQLITSSKHQFAIEDQSDLTNFYDELPKQQFACSYKFELDEFQKRSILHLQRKQSVFVAAHTSAGKTVVAEYGIALAIKHKRKVIYTSPIKALSNQKYRQLSIKFGSQNVGIVTGDVSMNQQASCVIMTTQILRNSLYRGAEMIRDIEWVIFDEVHYINNQERGVVWEETIIMLPEHIGIIMLSATVPNYMDFANWVGRTKHRIVYVMKTFHRPVPLEHSLYIFNKFHVIKEANGRFLKEQYNELHHLIKMADTNQDTRNKALKEQKKKKIQDRGFYNDARREQRIKLMNKNAVDKFIKGITKADMETVDGKEEHRLLQDLITDCNKKKLLPCVVFTFSKKKINALASKIYTALDLTNSTQKSKIARRISSALSNLKPEDQQIEQFSFLRQICMNGYAVHHGDLLPLAKQIVQLLFSQGLIKVLFATETFAMGINMPTKTVIFNSIKKPTGGQGQMRQLNSSQYVQMSGRAGRRGLDQKGTVIIIVKDPSSMPTQHQMQKMVDYPGQKLQSKFRVTYQIILNLLNSTDIGVTQMMRQSFFENPKFSEFTSNLKSLKQYQNQYQTLSSFDCPYNKLGTRILMDQYMAHSRDLKSANYDAVRQFVNDGKSKILPKYAKFLGHNNEIQIGILMKIQKFDNQKTILNQRNVQIMVVNKLVVQIDIDKQDRQKMQKALGIKKKVVLQYDQDKKTNFNTKFSSGQVPGTSNQFHYYVHWISPGMVLQTYSNKINSKSNYDEKKEYFQQISQFLMKVPQQLTPITQNEQKQLLQNLLITSHCHTCELKQKHQHQYERRTEVKQKMQECSKKIDKNELGLMGNFQGMLLVLQQFSFISQTQSQKQGQAPVNTLTLKGKIAKQVDIFVAQIIVQAVLDPLDSAEIAALLSAFVCDYKPRPTRAQRQKMEPTQQQNPGPVPKHTTYSPNLTKAITKTLQIISSITQQQQSCSAYLLLNSSGMQQHIMSIINFHLAETVYKWAVGFDFNQAKQQTKAPEGTIVRTIMRLSQLMANVKAVCRIIGNSQLEEKIDVGLQGIKRDIVFCQSLYLTG